MRISTGLMVFTGGLAFGAAMMFLVPNLTSGTGGDQSAVSRNVTDLNSVGGAGAAVVETQPLDAASNVQSQKPGLFQSGSTAGDVGRLTQVVASASDAFGQQNDDLTDEQKQIVAFFERTAREMNEAGGQRLTHELEFDHLAINGLDVKYYYTVRKGYNDLNPAVVMAEQRAYVAQTICNDAAVRQLIGDYGFRYSYAYLSAEQRLIGRIDASVNDCAG